MKYAAPILAASLLAACAQQPVDSRQTGIDCQNLVGHWSGEKLWSNGDISTWVARHEQGEPADGFYQGALHIEQESTRNGHPVRNIHEGTWRCRGSVMETITRDAVGRQQHYRYQIQTLDQKHLQYQYLEENGSLGTTYDATRINP